MAAGGGRKDSAATRSARGRPAYVDCGGCAAASPGNAPIATSRVNAPTGAAMSWNRGNGTMDPPSRSWPPETLT
jgi:hypothetical protein